MHFWEQPSHARNLSDRALELMRDYAIAPTPPNYELWFNYAIGQNQELVSALNTAVAEGRATDPSFTKTAYARFFGTSRPAEIGDVGAKLQEEVQKSKDVLEHATKDIASHGKLLAEAAAALAQGGNIKGVVDRVAKATRALQTSHTALEAHLDQTGREIETLRQRSETVTAENRIDPLTGLFSRASFDERLEPMLSEAEYNKTPLCVLIADVDSFRKFNDTWGHATGDHVLRLVAQCFKSNTRERDAAARFGGEEFAVALPNAALDSAIRVAEKIRETVESRKIVKRSTGETLGSLTLSIGVAEHRRGEAVAETVRRAASHLDAAKRQGRNRVVSDESGSATEGTRARA
ncbi:MAG: GGDEF domain-containing protein [Alphaproteobacteria bacterium]|nr:GGDEF domain-containing protein [Alphaproteobacteria bacterium]